MRSSVLVQHVKMILKILVDYYIGGRESYLLVVQMLFITSAMS
jgi:hypothetical protein